jgi:hypothetical protein
MKIEIALYIVGFIIVVASVLLFFKNLRELGSVSFFISSFISGLILIGFGKLLMIIEEYSERQLKELSRINDELTRLRHEREQNN